MAGLNKLASGLGAGLQVLGQGIINKENKAEETRRYNEESAREERRLKIAERDAESRERMAKFDLAIKRTEHNNKMLVNAVQQNAYDPTVLAKAFSDYGPSFGKQYEYDPVRSRELGEGAVAFKMSVNDTDPVTGHPKIGEDGKIIKKPLPEGFRTLEFQNRDEYVRYFTSLMAPDYMLAHELSGITAEQTYQRAQKLSEQKILDEEKFRKENPETLQAREQLATVEQKEALVGKTKAEAQESQSRAAAAGLDKRSPISSQHTDLFGNVVKETSQDVEKSKAFASELNKTGEFGKVDSNQAARILQLQDDPKAGQLMNEDMMKVSNNQMTHEEFKETWVKQARLPEAFVDSILAKVPPAETTQNGGANIFQKTLNAILGTKFGTNK